MDVCSRKLPECRNIIAYESLEWKKFDIRKYLFLRTTVSQMLAFIHFRVFT